MAFPFITTLVLCAAQGVVLDRPPGLVVVGIFKGAEVVAAMSEIELGRARVAAITCTTLF